MDSSDGSKNKVTYIPFLSHQFKGYRDEKEKKFTSLLESIYWQATGWVHTPSFITAKLDSELKSKVPKSTADYMKYQFHTKKSFQPKLQVEDKVPYGVLPKDVMCDLVKREFDEQDLKSILETMNIDASAILPAAVIDKNGIKIIKNECEKGIPTQPFLELDTFDDAWFYDAYSPEEWLSLGDAEDGRKPLSAIAFIPIQKGCDFESHDFEWCKVKVLDYDADKKLYLVRKNLECHNSSSSCSPDETDDLWILRIYLKFDAEEPLLFAKRLQTALNTRHMIEESLRMSYYVECMPLEDSPEWSKVDLDSIITKVRHSSQFQAKLQWIKDHLTKNVQEMQLEYKRAYNSVCYMEMAQQIPSLVEHFKNKDLIHNKSQNFESNLGLKEFNEKFKHFQYETFYASCEVIRALHNVESNILILRNLSLYNLPLNDIYTLENFEALQREKLQKISKYIHENWMTDVSNAILLNLKKCGKGQYDLNQTVLHTFKLTKLGRLLKMVNFKMQDVIRFLITESLEEYAKTITIACSNVMSVKDNFVWKESLCCNDYSPQEHPVFEVPLEIKKDHLQFAINLHKYRDVIRDLFEDGLYITKNLPKIEKFVMKKILYNPDDKLDSVGEKERNIMQWKMNISRGIEQAIIVATAYIRAYDEPLSSFKMDQINYVKQLARSKANCDQLKQVIEMHNTEKKNLENTIPSFIDIGPFRLMTKSVRTAAIKKHEQLADAVLGYFYTKLRQYMEQINNQFLMLLDRIDQPTGNVEDLLDKKQWCRTVPKRIEKLSNEVNQLRSDVKLISTFHRNMTDEDFNTFWQIQKLPQETMKKLQNRISMFDSERSQHREHLLSDQEKLKGNLKKLRRIVANFVQYHQVENASSIATEIRKARKSLAKYDDQSQLYKKRERLFGLPITDYKEVSEISESLAPYEDFWLSTAEFKKYKERDDADLLTIDSAQLRATIKEFQSNLRESLGFFKEDSHPKIHRSVNLVLKEVDEFIATRLS